MHALSNIFDFHDALILYHQVADIIQLTALDWGNTRIDQPMEHDIHRGIRDQYHITFDSPSSQ